MGTYCSTLRCGGSASRESFPRRRPDLSFSPPPPPPQPQLASDPVQPFALLPPSHPHHALLQFIAPVASVPSSSSSSFPPFAPSVPLHLRPESADVFALSARGSDSSHESVAQSSDETSTNESDGSLLSCVKIRRRKGLVGLSSTPDPLQRDAYRFYCPICFMYYEEVLKTSCCRNHICQTCTLLHIQQKQHLPKPPSRVPKKSLPITCPHCALHGVRFVRLQPNEQPRSYVESPKPTHATKPIQMAAAARLREAAMCEDGSGAKAEVLVTSVKIDEPFQPMQLMQNVKCDSELASVGRCGAEERQLLPDPMLPNLTPAVSVIS